VVYCQAAAGFSEQNGVPVEESNKDDVSPPNHVKIGSEEHRGASESTVD
jgi:hypothetical protein